MKRKIPTITQGRIQADIIMTEGEIQCEQDLFEWYARKGWAKQAGIHQRNIAMREAHLAELKEKMKYE